MIRRHPIRGLLGGLLIGLGLALLLVIYGAAPFGAATVLVIVIVLAVVGAAAAWVLPARSRQVVVAAGDGADPVVVHEADPMPRRDHDHRE